MCVCNVITFCYKSTNFSTIFRIMNKTKGYLEDSLKIFGVFIVFPTYALTIILTTGWLVYFIVKCWRVYKEYKTCKRTPVLHPLYSDVQYLSKQRKLYNLKTHFTKYILMIVCCSFEVASFICIGNYLVIVSKLQPLTNDTNLVIGYLNCTDVYFGWFATYNEYPFVIPILNTTFLLIAMNLFLLLILSRYLAMRYLNHPFKRTLIKYLIWCSIQCILIGFCSTKYTWMFMVLIFPVIGLTNWIMLLRATSFLSRVLRSHLMDIKLYSNNIVFYNAHLSTYNFYRIFRIFLLISTSFSTLFGIFYYTKELVKIFLLQSCYVNISGNILVSPLFLRTNSKWVILYLLNFVDALSVFIYTLSVCLPLCFITFAPLIIKCVKRCREKEDQYRYNYEKLEPLLRRHY